MRHPDDQQIYDEIKAAIDAQFRRSVVGIVVGGALGVFLAWATVVVGILPGYGPVGVLMGFVFGCFGVLGGMLAATGRRRR